MSFLRAEDSRTATNPFDICYFITTHLSLPISPQMAQREFCAELEDRTLPFSSVSTTFTQESTELLNNLAPECVGFGTSFSTPFGTKKLVYADWTASGRALRFVEKHITEDVLPFYGNTHTTTSVTGLQSTCFRHEARQVMAQAVNANTRKDVVLFVGHGATGAVNRLVQVLGLHLPLASDSKVEDRAIVFVGPHEHHSNLLPWRESSAEVVVIGEDANGQINVQELQQQLLVYQARKVKIGTFAAASNVTGILAPVDQITAVLHRHGALSFWDYATAAPYVRVDMNPVVTGEDRTLVSKDAIFVSPHKFVGGPNTPGVLVAKKALFTNSTPTVPGGGTVFYVTENDHRYLSNRIEREEGGTPDIVGSIRTGMAFHVKQVIGVARIEQLEHQLWSHAKSFLINEPNVALLGNLDAQRLPM